MVPPLFDQSPRGHIEHLVIDDLAWQAAIDPDGLSGWRLRRLSEDPASGARSFVAGMAPCWRRQRGWRAAHTQEFLVLRGDLTAGPLVLGPGDYLRYPKGSAVPPMHSRLGCEVFVTADGPLMTDWEHGGDPAIAPVHLPLAQRVWHGPPAYEGRSLDETVGGMVMQTLRADAPDEPYTFLVRCDGGWADPREESHETWEELLLLSGDYLMGDFGRLDAGSYIFRPGFVPHGPQATARGSMFLARGEKLINFCFRPIHDAERMIADYFAIFPLLSEPRSYVTWL